MFDCNDSWWVWILVRSMLSETFQHLYLTPASFKPRNPQSQFSHQEPSAGASSYPVAPPSGETLLETQLSKFNSSLRWFLFLFTGRFQSEARWGRWRDASLCWGCCCAAVRWEHWLIPSQQCWGRPGWELRGWWYPRRTVTSKSAVVQTGSPSDLQVRTPAAYDTWAAGVPHTHTI